MRDASLSTCRVKGWRSSSPRPGSNASTSASTNSDSDSSWPPSFGPKASGMTLEKGIAPLDFDILLGESAIHVKSQGTGGDDAAAALLGDSEP